MKNNNHKYKKYPHLNDRTGVWKEIVRYASKDIKNVNRFVELGAGYCDFINHFPAKEKIGYDLNPEMSPYAKNDVDLRIEDAVFVKNIGKGSVDMVFASNFLEHLDQDELGILMPRIFDALSDQGVLVLIQPNYRLCKAHYFDDETHKTIFSDRNMGSFLKNYGFDLVKLIPGFLPFSMKSRLPKWPFLVRLYLISPFKPMAAQMYVVAKKGKRNVER